MNIEKSQYITLWLDVRDICMEHGGSVTGGPRTQARNEKVGGHPNSWHLWKRGGLAADLAFDTPEGKLLGARDFRELGYEVIMYDTHIHVEPR